MLSMNALELRADATAERAVETFRQVGVAADNLNGLTAGASPEQVLNHYLSWTEEAERLLGNVLDAEVVSDLVHTQRYWTLRTATGELPRLVALVLAEADSRRRVLEEAGAALQRERLRWKGQPARLVVPDTNMFLQADAPFEAIDWHAALASQGDIRLVVPHVVVYELDRLKRQGNSTTARLARASLRWLAANLPDDPNGPPAKVAGGGSEPQTTIEVYVPAGPSRPEDADGVIIRFARQLGRISGMPTVLVTRDLGMRLRAVALGVDAVQLPEAAAPEKSSPTAAAS